MTFRRPGALLASALLLASVPPARPQATPLKTIPDPANLMGERVSPQSPADTLPLNHGAAALQQLLLKLRTRASLMLIVAHPDDEDGGMLAFESRGQGARAATLTLTRGEGGQNLMTADFNDALGLIRTQELLAADRYMGVDQFFGTEVDFGFSKTKEESFEKWTHQRVLYDAVRCVRLYRPLVLASVFVGGPTDGHGQHQVSGEITQEVFLAAADPKVFPEMGLPPWAPLKVYARVPFARVTSSGMYDYATGKTIPTRFHNYVTGADTTSVPTASVLIHEGTPATVSFAGAPPTPALGMEGKTYVQFAREGLALQKTQIGSNVRLAPAGRFDVGYTLMGTRINPLAPDEIRGPESADERNAPPISIEALRRGSSLPSQPGNTARWLAQGFAPMPSSSPEQSLFDGIDTSIIGIADLAPDAPAGIRASLTVIDKNLAEAQRLFDPAHLDRTSPPLREALQSVDNLITLVQGDTLPPSQRFNLLHELRIKRVQLNNALVLALGVSFVAKIETDIPQSSGDLVAGSGKKIAYQLHIKGDVQSYRISPTIDGGELTPIGRWEGYHDADKHGTNTSVGFDFAEDVPSTRPYFFRPNIEQPYYDLSDPALRNAPATPNPVRATATLTIPEAKLEDQVSVVVSATQSAARIVPKLSVQVSPSVGITPMDQIATGFSFSVDLFAPLPAASGHLGFQLPSHWLIHPESDQFTFSQGGQRRSFPEEIIPKKGEQAGLPLNHLLVTANAVIGTDARRYKESFRPVGYPGLTYTNYYIPATYKAVAVDVHTAPNLKVAYLPGTGDSVPDFLPDLGVTPTILTPKDLTLENLKQYDAVVLGVRVYAAHPDLAGPGSKPLNDYAAAGGVVIVQYNSSGNAAGTAPYPFNLPGDPGHNVVEESDPVRILVPGAPLLNWPNKIASSDFDHWVEERGHGFATDWSPEYTPLLETHDPGQDPQEGGLLVARVGRGAYIYCALALYRQLLEAVPGAYRLFANLLSYAKNPLR